MITFADLGPVPTVHLFLRVPVPMPTGGWTWGQTLRYEGVLARDYAYSAAECRALVHTYGRTIQRVVSRRELGDRYTVLARGPVTGMVLGLQEWDWCQDMHDYRPAGEYLCGWREAARQYFEVTGELIDRKRFSASTRPQLVDQGPYVGHKHDVPHEGALPDLYGPPAA
jgi:hypothetical protein